MTDADAPPPRRRADPIRTALAHGAVTDPPTSDLSKGRASTAGSRGHAGESQEVSAHKTQRGSRTAAEHAARAGPLRLLHMLGPGLITGSSDDDPSGIGTYSQVGAQFGVHMLWLAIFTFPLMAAVQELCARIALHTGVGLGVSLRKKFPTWIVGACVSSLVVANVFNLGADLGAISAGGELLTRGAVKAIWFVIPVGGLILALQLFGSYGVIFTAFKYLTLALFAYVATAIIAHPPALQILTSTFVPHVELSAGFVTAMVAVLGTTISPYLFFWQASSEVDEMKASGALRRHQQRGVTTGEMRAARVDVLVGMGFSQIVMYAIILSAAATLHAHGNTDIATATQAAAALQPVAGPAAFGVFAVGIIGTGLLAVPILSGSAAYALKEFFGFAGSLAVKPRDRPTFYFIIVVATVLGMAMSFVHIDPVRALFLTAVINGVVAPPLLVLITLLGSDRSAMGARTSRRLSRWLTWTAAIVMGAAAAAMLVLLVVPAS